MAWVGRDLGDHLVPTLPCHSRLPSFSVAIYENISFIWPISSVYTGTQNVTWCSWYEGEWAACRWSELFYAASTLPQSLEAALHMEPGKQHMYPQSGEL